MKNTSERLELLKKEQKKASAIYKPLFYRLNKPGELKTFNELLALPGIAVVDHILEQITEFVKLKSPGKRFSTDDLKSETEKHIGGADLNEYGVWAYYPWSNRLVHILDEEEFIEVRTSRNQYKITKEERNILAGKKIGVIGLSVGQSVSVTLAMERICGELRLADFDLLELTNLNRIRTGVHNLGLAKVYSVAREISEIDPFLKVVCFPDGLNEENMNDFFTAGGKLDLMVEESDGFDIKILSRYKARELKIPVIMEASDKCMVDVERFDLEPDRSILHGIVKHLDVEKLKSLKTNEEKIPYMLDVLGLNSSSPRLKASMLEMQQTITTWPQLASAVTMGGGITADVSRRMLLNHFTESGRYYVDIDQLIGNKNTPQKPNDENEKVHPELSFEKMKSIAGELGNTVFSEIEQGALEEIVEAAIMAPSYGNKQSWKWLSSKGKLFLFLDKKQASSFNDTDMHLACVSVGAALENALIKAEELAYEVNQELFPLSSHDTLAAVFHFKKRGSQKTDPGSLSSYIPLRQTNRKAGNGKTIQPSLLKEFTEMTNTFPGSSLTFIEEKEKIEHLSQIAGIIERMRLLHPLAHRDYFINEIRWGSAGGGKITEGIDVKTLELSAAAGTAFEVIADPKVAGLLNEWNKGIAFEKLSQNIISSSSAIGLITMPADSKHDFINGGRLAERIWLAATKNNLAFQPICVPLSFLKLLGNKNKDRTLTERTFSELKALKAQLSLIFSELNSREAVFLFRLFEADKPLTRSLRKPLNEVYFKS
jgi:tRNA A37 threonylcarbamoyladenosine dehydratase